MMKTVVAVSYGDSSAGGLLDCEVLTYPLELARGGRAKSLIAASAPLAGELDEATAIKHRAQRLTELGGHYEQVSAVDLAAAEDVCGSAGREVLDADYSERIGRVLIFDAEVDEQNSKVDWSTAVPHSGTDPRSLTVGSTSVRADGVVIDTEAIAAGRHQLMMDAEGAIDSVNEFGVLLHYPGDEVLARESELDISWMEVADVVVCTSVDGQGRMKTTTQLLSEVERNGGAILDPLTYGFASRAVDHEMLQEVSGESGTLVQGADGKPMWVGIVRAPCDEGLAQFGGNRPLFVLNSDVSPQARALSPSFDAQGRLRVFGEKTPSLEGMLVREPRRYERGPSQPVAEREPVFTATEIIEPQAEPKPKRAVKGKALAGLQAKVRDLAATNGPQIAEAVRSVAADPVLRERLLAAGQLAVAAAVSSGGGGKAKLAAGLMAASTNKDLQGVAKDAGRQVVSTVAKDKGYTIPGL